MRDFSRLTNFFPSLAVVMALFACATPAQISPRADGTQEAVAHATTGEEADEKAADGARDYCAKDGREMVVVSREQTATGLQSDYSPSGAVGMGLGGGGVGLGMGISRPRPDYRSAVRFECREPGAAVR